MDHGQWFMVLIWLDHYNGQIIWEPWTIDHYILFRYGVWLKKETELRDHFCLFPRVVSNKIPALSSLNLKISNVQINNININNNLFCSIFFIVTDLQKNADNFCSSLLRMFDTTRISRQNASKDTQARNYYQNTSSNQFTAYCLSVWDVIPNLTGLLTCDYASEGKQGIVWRVLCHREQSKNKICHECCLNEILWFLSLTCFVMRNQQGY